MPNRRPCSTGYICPAQRKTSEPVGCGRWYAADPAGTDAWWFTCECGELAGPATRAEVDGLQLGFEIDVADHFEPRKVEAGFLARCDFCDWQWFPESYEAARSNMVIHLRGSVHRQHAAGPALRSELEGVQLRMGAA